MAAFWQIQHFPKKRGQFYYKEGHGKSKFREWKGSWFSKRLFDMKSKSILYYIDKRLAVSRNKHFGTLSRKAAPYQRIQEALIRE